MAHDVFVSHSVKDKVVADAVVARLEAKSVTCWVAPRDVVPGADWGESIINAIESSRIMILIFSKNANQSSQIKREVERAVNKEVYIIPFRIDDISPTRSLEYFISTSQWMDAFSPPLERHLDNLTKTVKAVLANPSLRKPVEIEAPVSAPLPEPVDNEPTITPAGRIGPVVDVSTAHPSIEALEGSPAQTAKIGEILPYALIALASFVCGIGVLVLMPWKAETLTKLGLIGNLYYVVLLPLGLCAAVFLFGVVRSFARYKGEQYGGNLELGGPIVAFVLVVGGGFVLVPKPPSTFPLTVYVHGESARNDLVLRNSGRVFVDLDGDRQSRSIGENGEAYFPAIPDRFRGQEVPIWVDATGFESTIADQKQRVDGGSLYLAVRKKSGHVSGRVQDQDGNPISGAELSAAGVLTHSDGSGHFELIIPGDKLEQEMDLQAVAHGYKAQKYKVVPDANELTITLPTAP